jgi:DNA-directed RNA polymerase subunit alpha
MGIWKKVVGNGDWPLFVDKEEQSAQFGRFCIQPLQKGYGAVIGRSLRISLMESLPGAAVSALRFRLQRDPGANASRESTVLRQVIEHLEKLRLVSAGRFPLTGTLKKRGPCAVLPSDLTFSIPAQIVFSAPTLTLLETAETLELSFLVQWGKGKATSEKASVPELPQGWLRMNRNHSPARKIDMDVVPIEVGAHQGNEQLIIEITTDGSISPEDAIRRAGQQVKLPHRPLAG